MTPSQPLPTPTAPPPPPSYADFGVQAAGNRQRAKPKSTIATSGMGDTTGAYVANKTLLGQ